MVENHRSILRSSFGVAFATLLARILGLARVILEARILGGGALAASWQLAFMVPNLFRRLLGEGALGTALIPIVTHLENECGERKLREQLGVIFVMLSALLAAITIVVSAGGYLVALCCDFSAKYHYVQTALYLLPLIMPYAIFICLIGIMGAIVNVRKLFFLAALAGLTLNVVIVAVLMMLNYLAVASESTILRTLAVSVIGAGVLQLLMMVYLMHKVHIAPLISIQSFRRSSTLSELFKLAIPGLIGAGAGQISFMIDRGLACYVGDYAVPALNNTERLVYLPIGVFAIALSSVLMARMSSSAARQDFADMRESMELGLRFVWFGCAPMAVFLMVSRFPVIRMLFMHGRFTQFNVDATAQALFFYAIGIPAFCAIKVILPGFYARKKMMTPLLVSLAAIGLNVIMSISLMFKLQQGGIALATVLSSMVNNMILLLILRRQQMLCRMRPVAICICRSVGCALFAAVPLYWYDAAAALFPMLPGIPHDTMPLIGFTLLFSGIYLTIYTLSGGGEGLEMLQSLRRRKAGATN